MPQDVEPFAAHTVVHHPALLTEGWVEESNKVLTCYRDTEGILYRQKTYQVTDGPIPGGDLDRSLTPGVVARAIVASGLAIEELDRRARATGLSLYNTCAVFLEDA